jgi:dienelactone hydrolase
MIRQDSGTAGRRHRRIAVAAALALAALTVVAGTRSASAADNPYQRGPDPTAASIAATYGPFATAQLTVPPGNGFNGGYIYYPTDTSQGTWGAVAIAPGYSALFADEEAWMGPRLASFGFVVFGIETLSRSDGADARATELLAALDYLTRSSAVRDRVDPDRLSVMGHSAGGAGALTAALRRPSLKTVVGLAPGAPGGGLNLANLGMPTMFLGGQNDPTVTPTYLNGLWTTLPATTQRAWVEIAGADHLYFTRANNTEGRLLVPWLKTFLDNDARYPQFMCPRLADMSGISNYRNSCPLVPPGGGSPSTPPTSPSTPPTSPSSPPTSPSSPPTSGPPGGACTAVYRTVGSWPGGFQGEVTVTAGASATNGWTVHGSLASGQSITQVWNGILKTDGSSVSVTNAAYNGSLPARGSTTFGFLGGGTASAPALTCTSP